MGLSAQHKGIREQAGKICGAIGEGGYVAVETEDNLQVEGAVNKENFYICRVMKWDDGEVQKKEKRTRGTVGGRFNTQPVKRGDPLYRASYFKIDEADSSGLTFVDTGAISTVSGLGFRRVLGQGTFTPKPKPGASTRRSSRSMSLLGGANASSHIVPRWMQWNLELGEKQEIRSAIHSAVPQ